MAASISYTPEPNEQVREIDNSRNLRDSIGGLKTERIALGLVVSPFAFLLYFFFGDLGLLRGSISIC